jgi:hypothetical protein
MISFSSAIHEWFHRSYWMWYPPSVKKSSWCLPFGLRFQIQIPLFKFWWDKATQKVGFATSLGLRSSSYDPTGRLNKLGLRFQLRPNRLGKPMILHLQRCQEIAVANYSFTLGRLDATASSTFATSWSIEGPLSIFLGSCATSSCPEVRSDKGSRHFKTFYELETIVLGAPVHRRMN